MTHIPLTLLYDLKDRLDDCIATSADRLHAERAALDWAEANGLFARLGDDAALRDQVTVAPLPSPERPEPERPAGGAAHRRGTARTWTKDEDAQAIAMKVRGATVRAIAAALGRTEASVSVRLYQVLKPRLDAARAVQATPEGGAAPENPADTQTMPVGPKPSTAAAAGTPGKATVAAAEPPPAAPTVIAVRAPVGAVWHPEMTAREVEGYLAALPPVPFWTPQRDFALASAIWSGEGVAGFMDGLVREKVVCARTDVIARWRRLCPVVSLHNQQLVNAALKARAPMGAEAAE